MVTKVIGIVDGHEVILQHKVGERWEVPIPTDEDGEYVVEIMAEDDAGNRAYMAKMLFIVNRALLCAHVVPLPYFGEVQEAKYTAEMMEAKRSAELIINEFVANIANAKFSVEVIKPHCKEVGFNATYKV